MKNISSNESLIDLKTLIKNYANIFFFSIFIFPIIFIFLNIFLFKKDFFIYNAKIDLFSVPKYSIPEVETGTYKMKSGLDDIGLNIFSIRDDDKLTKGYNKFYKEVENDLKDNLNQLNKFDNFPELFIKFLKLDNSIVDNVPDSIFMETWSIDESKYNTGIIEILTVQAKISGKNPDHLRKFIDQKVINASILFKKFMRGQIDNLSNDLMAENQVKSKKIHEVLNLRIEYLENQIIIAKQQNILEPVRTTIDQGTDYLKGVNLLNLEITKARDDLINLSQGKHYLLYDNQLLLDTLNNSIFMKEDSQNSKNILFTFFYDKDYISIVKMINPELTNLFIYYMIFCILFIITASLVHFQFYSNKFNN